MRMWILALVLLLSGNVQAEESKPHSELFVERKGVGSLEKEAIERLVKDRGALKLIGITEGSLQHLLNYFKSFTSDEELCDAAAFARMAIRGTRDPRPELIRESLTKLERNPACLDQALLDQAFVEENARFSRETVGRLRKVYFESYLSVQLDRIETIANSHRSIERVYLVLPIYTVTEAFSILRSRSKDFFYSRILPNTPFSHWGWAGSLNEFVARASFAREGNTPFQLIALFPSLSGMPFLEKSLKNLRPENLKNFSDGEAFWSFLWDQGGVAFIKNYEQYDAAMKVIGQPPVPKYAFEERLETEIEQSSRSPELDNGKGEGWFLW